jgi:hypothetical protein
MNKDMFEMKKLLFYAQVRSDGPIRTSFPFLKERHLMTLGIMPGPRVDNMLRRALNHQLETGETLRSELVKVSIRSKK